MVWTEDASGGKEQIDIISIGWGDEHIDDINEITLIQKLGLQEENEVNDLEMNIQSAGKAGDLSPP